MKNIKLTILTTLIIITFTLGIKKYPQFNLSKNQKNDQQLLIKESFRILKECFDLDNKNKRTVNKSIELIEFCLEEYGN